MLRKNTIVRKIISAAVCAVMLAGTIAGCGKTEERDSSKVQIVATLFPQYDFARQIGGDKVQVTMLLSPGMESHSYDPTPADIVNINKSDLFIYTGKYMETWADTIIDSIDAKTVHVLDVSEGIELEKEEDEHEHIHEEDAKEHDHSESETDKDADATSDSHEEDVHSEDSHNEDAHSEENHTHSHEYDPHIWTSPVKAVQMVNNILEALKEVDPDNADYYTENANNYIEQLKELDSDIRDVVKNANRTDIYFGGRFAMHYFAEEYGLTCIAAYDSCSSETEPSAGMVAAIIDSMEETGAKVIYHEELVDPQVAETIADTVKGKTLLLHSCHNVSKEDFENGVTYLDLMKQNVINLEEGLK